MLAYVGRTWAYVGDVGPMLALRRPILADVGSVLTYVGGMLAYIRLYEHMLAGCACVGLYFNIAEKAGLVFCCIVRL